MNADELIAKLQTLTPEQRKLPLHYLYQDDETGRNRVGTIDYVEVTTDVTACGYGSKPRPQVVQLS